MVPKMFEPLKFDCIILFLFSQTRSVPKKLLIVPLLDIHVQLETNLYDTMMCTCAHKSNRKKGILPFEYMQSLTTVVKVAGRSVAKKEERRACIKARSKIL